MEIGPLKQRFVIAIRMAVVLFFLLGMPLLAVPRIAERCLERSPTSSISGSSAPHPTAAHTHASTGGSPVANRPMRVPARSSEGMLANDSRLEARQRQQADLSATIESLKAQLVEAGVSYMMLERIGNGGSEYRFQFDVPIAAGSGYRKRFQVVHAAPDEAMRRALAELREWRLAQREPEHLERPTVILR